MNWGVWIGKVGDDGNNPKFWQIARNIPGPADNVYLDSLRAGDGVSYNGGSLLPRGGLIAVSNLTSAATLFLNYVTLQAQGVFLINDQLNMTGLTLKAGTLLGGAEADLRSF